MVAQFATAKFKEAEAPPTIVTNLRVGLLLDVHVLHQQLSQLRMDSAAPPSIESQARLLTCFISVCVFLFNSYDSSTALHYENWAVIRLKL